MVTLDNRHIFWQAFLIASVIFWFGILIGTSFERSRIEEVQGFYFDSESDLFDFDLSTQIVYDSNLSCNALYEQSVLFADKIFKEASKLEKYDDSNKLTKELISLHRRYDILRTHLWYDLSDVNKKCDKKRDIIVYLYDYVETPLTTKATQGAMSNLLVELKQKYKNNIILIPIATDTSVSSLDDLREIYGLEKIPVIFVNNKYKFDDIDSLKDVESTLDKSVILL